jgi:phosphoribosylformylglycinamidine synthase
VSFKVETHNRPSALEPYGGANTGIGGVIRDTLGTGLGAKPICNTDVFCFAPPDFNFELLPNGVLHPRRLMKSVVEGVRDYGNRMGIPTVNGAVYFDKRYLGNPMVFCGSVGLIPHDKSFKRPQENDLIVAIGGRTGRDGIHGATFSSVELTDQSESVSSGAVQIGNAITEKMVLDVLLQARDRNLFHAVTDCGAGGFSSAIGEMGEEIGAEVWLERAPLKYKGLSYSEIWISEAQERMVLAVSEKNWAEFRELCDSESVEATVIGQFKPTGHLKLTYNSELVADLSMRFLHRGRPRVVRDACYRAREVVELDCQEFDTDPTILGNDLRQILGSWNVASKHWIIRQYDHEVQGGSVIKPLVGIDNSGPSDASVIRPRLELRRGLVIGCGMNPYLGDLDTYHMAASSIDEAIRNCVAVGADPRRIAILDNFCWGNTDRPETLGSLVRAARACHDVALAYGTPFISGKDSLNNEFSFVAEDGKRQTICIPPTLLISAMGQIEDVKTCVTMDLKSPGNRVYQVGRTGRHLGGSHWTIVRSISNAGRVPTVDAMFNRGVYERLHEAIERTAVRSCHDMSEGGLVVCAAEMAFAGGLGMELRLSTTQPGEHLHAIELLFAESNGRFLCEVEPRQQELFESIMNGNCQLLGTVTDAGELRISIGGELLIRESLDALRTAWHEPLDWDRT